MSPVAVLPILLLPPVTVGLDDGESARIESAIRDRLSSSRPDRVREGPAVEECDEACAADLASRHDAAEVVVVRVARLAGSTLLRMTVFDAARGEFVRNVQETAGSEDLAAAARALCDRLYPPDLRPVASPAPREPGEPSPPRDRTPWYASWWAVTGAGTIVAGVVVTAVLLSGGNEGGGGAGAGGADLVVPPSR